jgi:cardiolipin synthase
MINDLFSVGVIWITLEWVIRIAALFVVPRNRKPSSATAWLLVIFFFPTLGILFFLLLGSPKLPKSRRAAQKTLDKFIDKTLVQFKKHRDSNNLLTAEVPQKFRSLAQLSESLSHLPPFTGNKIEVLPEYDEVIKQIINDIDKAEQYVHLEYFIIALDEVTEPLFVALANAVQRSVIVRVMYDSISSKRYPNFKKMLARLEADKVHVQAMLPLKFGKGYVRPDLRNHRKLIIIDGHTGYTGSQNLIQRNYHRKDSIYYDELVVRLRGPVVLQLAAVFLTDWYSETGMLLSNRDVGTNENEAIQSYGSSMAQILPSGPGYEDENNLKLFTSLIHSAQKSITITNPYFVPDDALTTAITSAAKRGVDVVLINSEVMDQWMVGHAQRSFYEVLLKAGVKIYCYKAPILLHSKFITVDDEIATIGSSNLDIRSFELDLEVTLIAYDPKVVKELKNIEATYLARSTQVELKQWQKRPKYMILFDNIARLTSALQ